jgi:hypothetical protein
MKSTKFTRLSSITVLALGLIGFTGTAEAKPKSKGKNYAYSGSHHDRARSSYYAVPRTSFVLSLGTGYAGSGYYYGPPGVSYYYERPDVRYYRYRSQVPRAYYGEGYYGGGTSVAVQRELYHRGYYFGPIDGVIGSGSSRAIARYQADHGLAVTGYIDRPLLYSLGLA